MPEFNRTYKYGSGFCEYTLVFAGGIMCLNYSSESESGTVESIHDVQWHLTEVTKATGFRYI